MLPTSSGHGRLATIVLAVSVAVAFADSSIVVLALPQLYFDFHATMFGVSWVITAYNLVVAVTAFALVPFLGRISPVGLTRVGVVVFVAACAGCAASSTLWLLVLFRCIQGSGAALLLAGSLPLFGGLTGSRARGALWWGFAGTFGAAFGPALGGILEQAFDWRAIFVAQAPIVAAAFVVTFDRRAAHTPDAHESPHAHPTRAAAAGEILGFGALVGALFLTVLLVTTAWGHSPIGGALIVSVIPLGTLLARPVASALHGSGAAAAGAVLLAGGLTGMALLPGADVWIAVAALALCGVGIGLALPYVTAAALGDSRPRRATLSVAWRHVGLVVGILAVTPLLVSQITKDAEQAPKIAVAAILDAPVPLTQKVPFALKLRDAFGTTPSGATPDLAKVFTSVGGKGSGTILDSVGNAVADYFTRGFRAPFLVTALFALGLAAPILLIGRRRHS